MSLHLRFCCSTSHLLHTWVTCAHNARVEVVYTCLPLFGSMFKFANAVRRSMCTNYGKRSWHQRTTIDFSQRFFHRSCDVRRITASHFFAEAFANLAFSFRVGWLRSHRSALPQTGRFLPKSERSAVHQKDGFTRMVYRFHKKKLTGLAARTCGRSVLTRAPTPPLPKFSGGRGGCENCKKRCTLGWSVRNMYTTTTNIYERTCGGIGQKRTGS